MTEANGLPRERFFELILGTLFGSGSYQVYSAIIAERKYQPGFKAVLRLKDLRLAAEAAEQAGRELPMLSAVHRQMAETVAAGQGDRGWSAIAEYAIRGGI
ncbi:NAD-binding protein [Rhodopseudomonas parapalustris]